MLWNSAIPSRCKWISQLQTFEELSTTRTCCSPACLEKYWILQSSCRKTKSRDCFPRKCLLKEGKGFLMAIGQVYYFIIRWFFFPSKFDFFPFSEMRYYVIIKEIVLIFQMMWLLEQMWINYVCFLKGVLNRQTACKGTAKGVERREKTERMWKRSKALRSDSVVM